MMGRAGGSFCWLLAFLLGYSVAFSQAVSVNDSTETPADSTLSDQIVTSADSTQTDLDSNTTTGYDPTKATHPAFRKSEDSISMENILYYVPTGRVPLGAQVTNPRDHELRLTQQPTVALFKSMLVPGWGQLGNRQYIKTGIVVLLEGWLVSKALRLDREMSSRRNAYLEAVDLDLPGGERNNLYALFQDKRSQRNKYRWFSGLAIFFSMFDAYVDAHLSGMPDNKRNSKVDFSLSPDAEGGARASLSLSF